MMSEQEAWSVTQVRPNSLIRVHLLECFPGVMWRTESKGLGRQECWMGLICNCTSSPQLHSRKRPRRQHSSLKHLHPLKTVAALFYRVGMTIEKDWLTSVGWGDSTVVDLTAKDKLCEHIYHKRWQGRITNQKALAHQDLWQRLINQNRWTACHMAWSVLLGKL